MTSLAPPIRVRVRHVEWVQQRLSSRDTEIIHTLHRLRLITGAQLERLHFAKLSPASRGRTRRRVLNRLVTWRVLTTLDRRVGGVRAGSDGLIYTLDTAGQQLIRLDAAHTSSTPPRRPRQLATAFTSHILAVTDLYVRLVEHSRIQPFEVTEFDAEPACWWPTGLGGFLKPDAYTLLSTPDYNDAWWIEADLGTESLPRLRKKLQSYLDFAQGGIGPGGVMPRVLITTPTAKRCTAIKALSAGLQAPAEQLFHPVLYSSAIDYLIIALLVDQ